MRIVLFILCSLLLFSGCKKYFWRWEKCDGQVLDYHTDKGIAGAEVVLIDGDKPLSDGIIAKTYTDELGYFDIKVYLEENTGPLSIATSKDKYYHPNATEQKKSYSNKIYRHDNILYLVPPGYVKFHFENSSPFDENDQFIFANQIFTGKNVNVTLLPMEYRSKEINWYPYAFIKNNIRYERVVQFTAVPNDTVVVEVPYY